MFRTALGRFRFMGLLEGSSLLILLFVAMPLKYWFSIPEAVTVIGRLHGYIFLVYLIAIVYVQFAVRWPFRFTIGAIISAFIPFGNFVLDSRMKKLEAN